MKTGEFAPGVEIDATGTSGDRYRGKPDALIAAGLITAAHIPTNASQTFVEGVKVDGRKYKGQHDERWMQVTFIGRALQVTKGISEEERARRIAARNLEAVEAKPSMPRKDPGAQAVREMDYRASAAYSVGDDVLASGQPATVTMGYGLHRVAVDDGEFLVADRRTDYLMGYTCRLHSNGKEFFYPARNVQPAAGGCGYLRLVSGFGRKREIGFSIRSLA